jgi:hypothetical protein
VYPRDGQYLLVVLYTWFTESSIVMLRAVVQGGCTGVVELHSFGWQLVVWTTVSSVVFWQPKVPTASATATSNLHVLIASSFE